MHMSLETNTDDVINAQIAGGSSKTNLPRKKKVAGVRSLTLTSNFACDLAISQPLHSTDKESLSELLASSPCQGAAEQL